MKWKNTLRPEGWEKLAINRPQPGMLKTLNVDYIDVHDSVCLEIHHVIDSEGRQGFTHVISINTPGKFFPGIDQDSYDKALRTGESAFARSIKQTDERPKDVPKSITAIK